MMSDLSLLAACAETRTEMMDPVFRLQGTEDVFFCTEHRTTALMYYDGINETE